MNKKIISLITALLLVFQCFTVVGANGAKAGDIAAESVDFLRSIGIVEGEIDTSAVVTRGDAARYIAAMFGNTYKTSEHKGVFVDVPADNPNATAIESLADFGIVFGDGKYNYYPESYLTYTEAANMFANVLGYGVTGKVPSQSLAIVSKDGVFDGVKAEYEYVSLSDLLIMIYNALHCKVLEQTTYGSKVEYRMSEDDILSKNFGILYTYGIVVKNDLSYLWSATDADEPSLELELDDGTMFAADISKKNSRNKRYSR